MNKTLLTISFIMLSVAGHAQIGDLSRIGLLTFGGLPIKEGTTVKPKVLISSTYISGYDEQLRNPLWVAYRLGNPKDTLIYQKWERPDRFAIDERTESKVSHDAFNGTPYQRGHMAPNATMLGQYGQISQLETYLMTNICPQRAELNERIWAQLEKFERESIAPDDTKNKEIHDVYVITGPIFDKNPERIGQNVAVPSSFYRIIAFRKGYQGTVKAVGFVIPQLPPTQNLSDYYRSVDEIEQLTGLNFFPKLSELQQKNLESKKRDLSLTDL